MFMRYLIQSKRINFTTFLALLEVKEMKKHPENYKCYTRAEDLFLDIENDEELNKKVEKEEFEKNKSRIYNNKYKNYINHEFNC